MNLKIELQGGKYAIAKRDTISGFKLEVYTPSSKIGAKSSHVKRDLYYPRLELLSRKMMDLGVTGDSLQGIADNVEAHAEKITKALEELA